MLHRNADSIPRLLGEDDSYTERMEGQSEEYEYHEDAESFKAGEYEDEKSLTNLVQRSTREGRVKPAYMRAKTSNLPKNPLPGNLASAELRTNTKAPLSECDAHPAVLESKTAVSAQRNEQPKRHISEVSILNSEWTKAPPWKPKQAQDKERMSGQSLVSTMSANESSSLSIKTYGNIFLHPPGLMPQMGPPACLNGMYSADSLLMAHMQMPQYNPPMYQIPEYYPIYQQPPPVLTIPINTIPYNYPYGQIHYRPEPKRYSSSKQQILPPQRLVAPEDEEMTHPVIKQYRESGCDCKKLTGQVLKLARTQGGSRFLQKEVDKGDPALISFFLHEVKSVE